MLKLAISADGKAGGAGRKPMAITGEAVRDRVHLLRAKSDAIMIGIGTVLADDPMLTCRLPGMEKDSPVRIVADVLSRLPVHSRLVKSAHETPVWALVGTGAPQDAASALRAKGVNVSSSPASGGLLDLKGALGLLAAKGITRLMVEGGPTLAAALIAADLVDEAYFFYSAVIVGADGLDALDGPATAGLAKRLRRVISEPVGPDRLDRYERV
jgi:diaminohydroxyphosphoribosylaminopyrimidine deaminase/5-amino-6-(5-phosphoribosylamino)uracil reductase